MYLLALYSLRTARDITLNKKKIIENYARIAITGGRRSFVLNIAIGIKNMYQSDTTPVRNTKNKANAHRLISGHSFYTSASNLLIIENTLLTDNEYSSERCSTM